MELKICHLYPDVLNLYGDTGNILCMSRRLQ
jgi:CobQ-like glutamine amidotransferase family enzyme